MSVLHTNIAAPFITLLLSIFVDIHFCCTYNTDWSNKHHVWLQHAKPQLRRRGEQVRLYAWLCRGNVWTGGAKYEPRRRHLSWLCASPGEWHLLSHTHTLPSVTWKHTTNPVSSFLLYIILAHLNHTYLYLWHLALPHQLVDIFKTLVICDTQNSCLPCFWLVHCKGKFLHKWKGGCKIKINLINSRRFL